MKIKINDFCVGCKRCVNDYPEYIGFNEDRLLAFAKTDIPNEINIVNDLFNGCPIGAIEEESE